MRDIKVWQEDLKGAVYLEHLTLYGRMILKLTSTSREERSEMNLFGSG
jgi:hypothetical protein